MGWDGEIDFKHALRQVARGATRDRLAAAAASAVDDEAVAYKHVVHLCMKKLKEVKPEYRLRIFYAISAIVRQSVAKHSSRSRYVKRLSPQLDTIAELLQETSPVDQGQVARVLKLWWREGVCSPQAIAKLKARFKAQPGGDSQCTPASTPRHAEGQGGSTGATSAPLSSPPPPPPPEPPTHAPGEGVNGAKELRHTAMPQRPGAPCDAGGAAPSAWARPLASMQPPPPPPPPAAEAVPYDPLESAEEMAPGFPGDGLDLPPLPLPPVSTQPPLPSVPPPLPPHVPAELPPLPSMPLQMHLPSVPPPPQQLPHVKQLDTTAGGGIGRGGDGSGKKRKSRWDG